ncbi:hypothetical protein PPACK8108_LOCUS25321 [Phakopsora pachyrhizi]|uniref:Transcription initiation factor TFIID subunit 13 n=1 Tax=Phakopsora pachyrhizi TaxID=170000 RepID=A0AAV0BUZ3_PHAPC|nr:hypothetical protein PPACK8108_LOCUS25321 [Phakopsora pachyrhizi]
MTSKDSQSNLNQTNPRARQRSNKRGLFVKDLPGMMFGFGDSDPQRDVVNLMEEIVIDHISDILIRAHKVSTNRGKLKVEDIKFVLARSSTRVHNPQRLMDQRSRISNKRARPMEELLVNDEGRELAGGSSRLSGKYQRDDNGEDKDEGEDLIEYSEEYVLSRRKISLEEKQLNRIEELLFMQEDLSRARGRADDLRAYGQDNFEDGQAGQLDRDKK